LEGFRDSPDVIGEMDHEASGYMALRTLTILFTDVVRSTEVLAALGDREAERIRLSHYADLREQIERFAGTEVKTLGDGLMATFTAAQDAIECATAMQQASHRRMGPGPDALTIRIGLSSGDVRVEGGDCHGTTVVAASRLCAAASAGQVLMSSTTRTLAHGYKGTEKVGELELKGLPEPIETWEAPWAPDAPAKVRAVLADDAVLLREGIAHVLEEAGVEVVGQADDAEGLLRLAAELHPDIAIVDVRMPPTFTSEGLDAAERLRADHPRRGVLVLSQSVESHSASRLLATGPRGVGYLLKERVTDVRQFADAVRRVAAGGTAFEGSVISSMLGGDQRDGEIRELTEAETRVLEDRVA